MSSYYWQVKRMHKKEKKRQVCGKRIASVLAVLAMTSFFTLYNWTNEAVKTAHIIPSAPRINIENLTGKNELSLQELKIVSEQTGINTTIIKRLLRQDQGQQILELQKAYYEPISITSVRTTPLTICEYVIDENGEYTKGTSIVNLQDGDIVITKNSRFLGWRNGHAGLVVDAEKGLILEAVMLGTNTKLCSISGWEKYPSFLVLRIKEEFQNMYEIEKVVAFAEQNLLDIPYQLHAGIWGRMTGLFEKEYSGEEKEQKSQSRKMQDGELAQIAERALSGTHCAHVVWYAYQRIGIDLDSDGGLLVTPYDIQNSSYLEVIQSYGY